MAFGDITKKAQQLLRDERVTKALKSEQAEGLSDKLLDGVAGAANKVTGGKHADKIDGARDAADKRIGDR